MTQRRRTDAAIVLRDLGLLQVVGAVLMLTPAVVGLVYDEPWSSAAFLIAAGIAAAVGALLYIPNRDATDPGMRHAMTVAAAGWLGLALTGALPFVVGAYLIPAEALAEAVPPGAGHASSLLAFRDPVHAVFEAMSGWTTTGLTMVVHEPSIPHAYQWWRSLMQWVGGVGVIVLALTVIRLPGGEGGSLLYRSEGRQTRLRPSIANTARAVWKVYLVVTAGVFVYLLAGVALALPGRALGRVAWEAVNHAMTGMATGGFSVLDASIGGYGSKLVSYLHVPPMVLGGIALPLYYLVYRGRRPGLIVEDDQTRTYLGAMLGGAVLLVVLLGGLDPAGVVSDGIFQWVSALSGTGWQTADVAVWPASAIVMVAAAGMSAGACLGSTTGGVKMMRVVLVGKALAWQVRRVFLPRHAVATITIGGEAVDLDEATETFARAGLYVLLYGVILVGSVVLHAAAFPAAPLPDVVFEAASAQGTVGLSSGLVGPAMPRVSEVAMIVQMWIGRLEIIPILVLIRATLLGFDAF